MPPRACKPTTTTSSPSPAPSSPSTNQPTTPKKCHYTINHYICTHKTWSKTPRITHQQPCPFALAYLSKSSNQNRVRCANMENAPRSVDVKELCPKCRPYTLGVGPGGKKVRELEVEVLEGDAGGGDENKEKQGDNTAPASGEDGGSNNGALQEDSTDIKGEWRDINPSSSSSTVATPSAKNGDAETPPSFSIFKRVLGAMIPGSSGTSAGNRDEKLKNGGGADKHGDGQESGAAKKGEGKGKGKQSWIQVDEYLDWEVVGGEMK